MTVNKDNVGQMWHDWFMTDAFATEKRLYGFFRILPHDPRCKLCNAPFHGIGGMVVGALYGRKQSSLNPRFCNVCEGYAKQFPGGAEVEMSMLFVDVRGSTALSEQMTPMEFQKLINRFFVESTRAIAEEDGLVEKLAGDAVAAFWGAGFAGQDYVARTVRAAQKIQKAMAQQKIPVGIGVHAGVAFFGALGSAEGVVNISAIGEQVNTAARLASKAAAGEIILSESALEQAHIDGSDLETRTLALKGISEPLIVRVMRL
ncbi:MAG: adenylate/guanylate cyclase domain-containing protein [Chloroflexota bacterium]